MEFLSRWIEYLTSPATLWLFFLVFVTIMMLAAVKVVNYSTIITKHTKVSSSFISVLVLAVVASIPELTTAIFQSSTNHPDIAISNVLGSNMFNMTMTAVCDLFFIKLFVFNNLNKYNRLLVWAVFFVSATISIFVFTGFNININIFHDNVGLLPIILMLVYLLFLLFSWFNEKNSNSESENEAEEKHQKHGANVSVKLTVLLLIIYSLILVTASLLLNSCADIMVKPYAEGGYNIEPHTVGGTILSWIMAAPEILSLFLLMRKGLVSMAMSAILGAQIFNFSILFFADIFYTKESIFKMVNHDKTISWISMGIAVIATILLLKMLLRKLFKTKFQSKIFNIIASSIIIFTYLLSWILIIAV